MSVFKAPLIVDQSFYKKRQTLQIVSIAAAIIIGVASSTFELNIYQVIPFAVLAGIVFYFQFRSNKKIQSMSKDTKVHMDESSINTLDVNGNIIDELQVNVDHRIIVKKEYSLPEEDIRASLNEMAGDFHKSFIIVDMAGDKKKYEFLMESHYMQVQLQKVIEAWRNRGINITSVD